MVDRWHDLDFAQRWDSTAQVGNPTRLEILDILVSIVAHVHQFGATILDLGIGSGRVEELLYARLPEARVVGVDGSPAMLALARERLAPVADRCLLVDHDFADIESLRLPPADYRLVISVQALHHAPVEQQRAVIKFAHDLLPAGGVFLLVERIALDAAQLGEIYGAMWERLERLATIKSGWDPAAYLQRLRDKADHVAPLEDHLNWLRKAGFAAACLHLHLDRALLVGVKPGA